MFVVISCCLDLFVFVLCLVVFYRVLSSFIYVLCLIVDVRRCLISFVRD